jgi:hypothetical protein
VHTQRFLDGIASAVLTGRYVDPALSRVTLGEWSARWLAQSPVKPSTGHRYASLLRANCYSRGATRRSQP